MKSLVRIFVALVALLSCAGCTYEGGDIGFFYGVWSLRSMTVDSEPADIDYDHCFWKFQNNVFFITVTDDYNDFEASVGSWSEIDGVLYLNFTYRNEQEGSEDFAIFNPPPALLIPGRAVTPMDITSLTQSEMVLTYHKDDDRVIVYKLKKLN